MSDCSWLSDRMPSVALRQAEWTADELMHLTECSSCQKEWQLVQAGIRLGNTTPWLRDPDALTRIVLQRLTRNQARIAPRFWAVSGLATAAAVAAAVWLGGRDIPSAEPQEAGAVVAGLHMPLPELESLQPAELESVLQTMDDSMSDDEASGDMGLVDLNSDELQQVLDTWEG
jgi:hypothetical protein